MEENRQECQKMGIRVLSNVNQVLLKRTYFESGLNKVGLQIFSDASLEAMCIYANLRKQNNGEVTLVIGKWRVAPIRNMTVAKLE